MASREPGTRDTTTDAGRRLARQSLSKPVTMDQICDIEAEAARSERERIVKAVEKLRHRYVSPPEQGGDSIDAEFGSLLNEVLAIIDGAS